MGLLRREYWAGLSFPSPGDFSDSGLEPVFLALADGFFTTVPPGKPTLSLTCWLILGSSTETTDIHKRVLDEEMHGTIKR